MWDHLLTNGGDDPHQSLPSTIHCLAGEQKECSSQPRVQCVEVAVPATHSFVSLEHSLPACGRYSFTLDYTVTREAAVTQILTLCHLDLLFSKTPKSLWLRTKSLYVVMVWHLVCFYLDGFSDLSWSHWWFIIQSCCYIDWLPVGLTRKSKPSILLWHRLTQTCSYCDGRSLRERTEMHMISWGLGLDLAQHHFCSFYWHLIKAISSLSGWGNRHRLYLEGPTVLQGGLKDHVFSWNLPQMSWPNHRACTQLGSIIILLSPPPRLLIGPDIDIW